MNSKRKINVGQILEERETKMKNQQRSSARKWRGVFQRRRKMHDPTLVFNMSIFNFTGGWNRTFNPLKVHENGT